MRSHGVQNKAKWFPNGPEASWSFLASSRPLEAVLEGSGFKRHILLNGSWPLQEEFQERLLGGKRFLPGRVHRILRTEDFRPLGRLACRVHIILCTGDSV